MQPTDGSPQCEQGDVNRVIKIDPASGTPVSTDAKITLYVGVAPGKARVPDLKNKTRDAAQQALTDAKLTLDTNVAEVEVDDPNQAGLVQSQTPTADSEVDEGTSVKITVAKSKELKQVQDFTGKPYSQADPALRGQGFKTKRVDQASDSVPKDSVITQNPNGGSVIPGTTITLTVSTGPEQTDKIEMPNLSGMTTDEAQSKLQSMGWTGNLRQQSDKTSKEPEGTITKQNVTPGTQIDKDQAITVGVSEGNGGFRSRRPHRERPAADGSTRKARTVHTVRAFFVSGFVEKPLDGAENLLGVVAGAAVDVQFFGGPRALDLQGDAGLAAAQPPEQRAAEDAGGVARHADEDGVEELDPAAELVLAAQPRREVPELTIGVRDGDRYDPSRHPVSLHPEPERTRTLVVFEDRREVSPGN